MDVIKLLELNVFCILDVVKVCKLVDSYCDYRDVINCIFIECLLLWMIMLLFCIKF